MGFGLILPENFLILIYPRGNSRRFSAWADYCRQKYGSRIQKVSVNAGFSCPNRDGTISYGGCDFCNNEGFNPSYCLPGLPITAQLNKGLRFLKKRYRKSSIFAAYFQAYSNTHAPLERLKQVYSEALKHPEISGIVIGTRPDCVDEEKLDYLGRLSENHFVKIEYGIESCYNETLYRINRGHTFEDSANAVKLSAQKGLLTGAHMIFGLPGESRQQMLEQVSFINELPLKTIKFHQLQIVKNTPMAEEFLKNPGNFDLFSLDEYIKFIVRFLERLRPEISLERFSGEVPPGLNVGKSWGMIRADQVISLIEQELELQDTWQGKKYQNG